MPAAADQEMVQALPADGANPALGDGIGVGRLDRCADDLGADRAQMSSKTRVNLLSRRAASSHGDSLPTLGSTTAGATVPFEVGLTGR